MKSKNLKKTSAKTWEGVKHTNGWYGMVPVEVRKENAGYHAWSKLQNRYMGTSFDTLAEMDAWMGKVA